MLAARTAIKHCLTLFDVAGLFVISGVRTCGGGAGYCLLGLDCTLDEDFLPDEGEGQHCEGLRSAFTPSAHFVCCRAANNYKQPQVPVTTPLDVLQNEVDDVLQKVAESVEAAKRTPAPEAELRETQSEGSTLLEEEVLESSIEGGVLQGDDGSEEGMQNDEEYRDEQEHASVDEELYQNDDPSEAVSVQQEPKIEDSSSEEKSTEENTISSESSESSEEESSSSSEETDSDEVLTTTTTTNKSKQKPPPTQQSPSVSEAQNDLKGNVDKDSVENNTEGVVSPSIEVTQEESETFTPNPEENVTEELMSKESLLAIDETNLDEFQRDENTKEPIIETSNPEMKGTTDKSTTSTEKLDISKEQIGLTPQNMTLVSPELSYSKPVKTKTKPLPGKKTANKDTSKPSSVEVSFNEVVSTTVDKKAEENSVHYEGRPVVEENVRTNSTNANSQTDTEGGFATDSSVYPEHQASGRPGSQGHEGVVCSRTPASNNNCSREIRFEFENHTLCFGSVYSLDWVVTSASCALRSVSTQTFYCR